MIIKSPNHLTLGNTKNQFDEKKNKTTGAQCHSEIQV